MSFAQELQDFASSFQKTYTAVKPSAYDREEAKRLGARQVGSAAVGDAAGSGRTVNPSTSWALGDTPGGAASTPSISALPTVEGGDATSPEMTDAVASDLARAGITPRSAEPNALPTFARGEKAEGMESDIAAAKAAIAGNESGGRYDAMGPVTGSGDRAYGKYQVMGKNIPQWTREAIGRAMTPQEFVKSPQAQEAVFEHVFGGNMRKYGFNDASSIWFSGRRQAQAGNAQDVLGTSVPKYVRMARATFDRVRPTQTFSRGGLVQAVPLMAEGGMIEEDTPAVEGNAEGRELMGDLTDPSGIADVIDDGMNYVTKVFGLDRAAIQGADPRAAEGARALALNVGAATPDQVQTVHKTVDPQGQMSPAMRQIAAYKAIHQYWMDRDEPEKAQRAVAAMALAAKDAAQVYGTVALQAARRGDAKIAAEAIAKGYDEAPDGHTMKITKTGSDGASFELQDINGNITDKGKFAMDEMIRVATGMRDGTEWLKTMGAIRTRTDARGAAAEKRRAALEEFDRAREPSEDDFIATLEPKAKEKYLRLDPRDKRALRKEHWDKLESERKQSNIEYNSAQRELQNAQRQENRDTAREDQLQRHLDRIDFKEREALRNQKNIETRMNTQTGQFEVRRADALGRWIVAGDEKLEKRAHDDRIKAFESARRQRNWQDQRETQMSQFERRLAEEQLKNDDRYQSAAENSDFRRQRAEEVDKRIMESAKVRRDAAAVSRAARTPAAPRLTAPERAAAVVDTTASEALTRENMAIPEMTGFDAPERAEAFGEAAGRVGAGRTYEAQEATRKGQPMLGETEKIREKIEEAHAKSGLSREKQNMLVSVASHIARANMDVDEPTATNIALAAGAKNTPIRPVRDRLDPNKVRIQVGDAQPVIMGSEALSMIAMLRGGALRGSSIPGAVATMEETLKKPPIVDPTRSSTAGPTAALPVPNITGNPDQRVDRGGPRAMNSIEQARITLAAHNLQKRKVKRQRRRESEREALTTGMPLP